MFHTIVSIKNDGHYFCRAGGNRPDGLNEPVTGLRQEGISEETQNDSCKKILTPTEWKLLWVKLEGKQLPSQTPTLKWACLKLGRWHDSKRTGRPGWVVMWDGWFRLQDMVEGYPVMKSLDQEI